MSIEIGKRRIEISDVSWKLDGDGEMWMKIVLSDGTRLCLDDGSLRTLITHMRNLDNSYQAWRARYRMIDWRMRRSNG